jgi:hypothetical protein
MANFIAVIETDPIQLTNCFLVKDCVRENHANSVKNTHPGVEAPRLSRNSDGINHAKSSTAVEKGSASLLYGK